MRASSIRQRLDLEALLNKPDGLRDGGGVAAPVALRLGEDGPPLIRDRVHSQSVSSPRRLHHRRWGREPPSRPEKGARSGGGGKGVSGSQKGGHDSSMGQEVVDRVRGPGAEVGEEDRGR